MRSTIKGKRPFMMVIDEWQHTVLDPPLTELTSFWQLAHTQGLLNQKVAAKKSARERERWIKYALKRARSNHPHNVRWKPLLEQYNVAVTAARVARKLERA